MSFPSYPAYKDSSVEWLGEVPQNWSVHSLKRTVDGCVNGLWGDEPDGENDIAVIRVADFERSFSTVGLDKLTYRSITPKERQSRLIKSGDLLIEKSGGGEKTLVGCVVLFKHEFDAITSNFVARMRPLAEFDSQFLCYAFGNLYHGRVNYSSVKQVTGIQNLDAESYLQERFCFPTRVEQIQIARFLDHETARIDALIEEQQRLIELLKEKRQAVISHAVTKGLDPTVPMKDSGVEWLGEVPAHWEITAVKYVVRSLGQGWSPQCDNYPAEDGEWGVLKVGCVNGGVFNPAENKHLPVELEPDEALAIKQGDLLISRANTRELVGGAAVATKDYPRLMLCDKLYRLRLSTERAAPEFLALYLGSSAPREQIELAASGASDSMQNISQSVVMDMPISLPPLGEQEAILQFLGSTLKNSDELVAKVTSQRYLLQERRSALISAAVTGKIDVRGWQPPASTQAPELEKEAV
ncbi:restriction endonuclease subunit S [Pseudomonas rhodesiae]|uniref:restriction endonuclease subunit S n=1 Tax=Pseudomonas rhodesiae TaxID=76760 RepID=UPI0028A8DF2C|nr:restriction endonuclease subunit S [Pseudomonas rhodesiae]